MRTYNITLGDSNRFLVTFRGEAYKTFPYSYEMTGTYTAEQARKIKREGTEQGYDVSILKLN